MQAALSSQSYQIYCQITSKMDAAVSEWETHAYGTSTVMQKYQGI